MSRAMRVVVAWGCALWWMTGCSASSNEAVGAREDALSASAAPVRTASEALSSSIASRGLPPERAGEVLAMVDGESITLLDFVYEVTGRDGMARVGATLPAERRAVLERILDEAVLAAEARRRGYDQLPEVLLPRRAMLRALLARRVAREVAAQRPTEEALHRRYEADPSRWARPARVRLRLVPFASREEAKRALEHLEEELRPERPFAELAEAQWHRMERKWPLGDVGPFVPGEPSGEVPEAVVRAAASVRGGQLVPEPVFAEGVWFVVRNMATEPAIGVPFEEARELLLAQWRRERAREVLQEPIREELASARFDERALSHVRLAGEVER